MSGYFKAWRSPEALELAKKSHDAFILLYITAYRAQVSDGFNAHGLKPGEALLGDYASYGMTERRYRTAKKILEKDGFVTNKTTNKGTILRLADTRIYDVNADLSDGQNDERATSKRRTKPEKSTSKTTNGAPHSSAQNTGGCSPETSQNDKQNDEQGSPKSGKSDDYQEAYKEEAEARSKGTGSVPRFSMRQSFAEAMLEGRGA